MSGILVIAPHPDDEILGCGGIMARTAARGDDVRVVVVTRGTPEVFPPDDVARCRKELASAHEILGVRGVRFLDFPAPWLDTVPVSKIADALRDAVIWACAEELYVPHAGDLHADHRSVYEASLVAARPISGCPIRQMFCYETLSETEWASPARDSAFVPTVFADISAHLETKLKAMSWMTTQLRDFPHPRSLRAIEALARFRGASAGLEAAEAFELVRGIVP